MFGLTRATAKLAAGTRTLTLRFSAAEQKRFRQLLKQGQQARAVITVKATTRQGNQHLEAHRGSPRVSSRWRGLFSVWAWPRPWSGS